MRYKVDWQYTALEDLKTIRFYLEQFSFETADRILSEIVDKADILQQFPGRCPKFGKNVALRRLIIGDYSVFYDIVEKSHASEFCTYIIIPEIFAI